MATGLCNLFAAINELVYCRMLTAECLAARGVKIEGHSPTFLPAPSSSYLTRTKSESSENVLPFHPLYTRLGPRG